jgi:hypothetical protein
VSKTKQQIRDEGQKALTIVDDEIFNTIVEEIKHDLFQEWMGTESTEAREEIHNVAVALEVILTRLRAKADNLTIERNH